MEDFTEHVENIAQYYPLRDEVLVTGNTILQKGNDIVDTEDKYAIKYIQTVVAKGPNVDDSIQIDDTVDINLIGIKDLTEHFVFLNANSDDVYLLIPSRYIRGKVVLAENIKNKIDIN